jgi:redox-sensitive bicupin YhaK (pirin superfamily)
MGFRALRVINEDRLAPGQGFGTHSHRDMEILSYVLEGALRHQDSTGTGSVIASQDGREGSITIHQDVNLYSAVFETGNRATLPLKGDRHIWVQVARGSARVKNSELSAGDGAALADESVAELEAMAPAEILLFDLA